MWTVTRPEVIKIGVWTVIFALVCAPLGYVDWHIFGQLGALLIFFLGVSFLAPYTYGWTDTPPKGLRGNDGGAPKGAA
jgi:hypothetical protein